MNKIFTVLFTCFISYAFAQSSSQFIEFESRSMIKSSGISLVSLFGDKKTVSTEDGIADDYQTKATTLKTAIELEYTTKVTDLRSKIKSETVLKTIRDHEEALIKAKDDRDERIQDEVKPLIKLERKHRYLARSENPLSFFAVHSAQDAQQYYENQTKDKDAKFLSTSLINFGSSTGELSLFNELFADYFGCVRVGFGALIATDNEQEENPDETEEEAVQRLLGGGGNTVLITSYPFAKVQSGRFILKSSIVPKFALDLPLLGATKTGKLAFNSDAGIETTVYYAGLTETITVYGNHRLGYVMGNSQFLTNIDKGNDDYFTLNQITIGVSFKSFLRLSGTIYTGGKFVKDNFEPSLSLAFLPSR